MIKAPTHFDPHLLFAWIFGLPYSLDSFSSLVISSSSMRYLKIGNRSVGQLCVRPSISAQGWTRQMHDFASCENKTVVADTQGKRGSNGSSWLSGRRKHEIMRLKTVQCRKTPTTASELLKSSLLLLGYLHQTRAGFPGSPTVTLLIIIQDGMLRGAMLTRAKLFGQVQRLVVRLLASNGPVGVCQRHGKSRDPGM